jgi:hypothetical protein
MINALPLEYDDRALKMDQTPIGLGNTNEQSPSVSRRSRKVSAKFQTAHLETIHSIEDRRLTHTYQTREFVLAKQRDYGDRGKARMGVWEAMEYLDTLIDDSDPDTDLPQIEHLLQTAEACRRDGQPRWFILTGLVREFQNYDLYSKSPVRPDLQELRPYYEQLIAEYFPPQISW